MQPFSLFSLALVRSHTHREHLFRVFARLNNISAYYLLIA